MDDTLPSRPTFQHGYVEGSNTRCKRAHSNSSRHSGYAPCHGMNNVLWKYVCHLCGVSIYKTAVGGGEILPVLSEVIKLFSKAIRTSCHHYKTAIFSISWKLSAFFFFFHHPSWAHSWVCDHYHLDYSYTGNWQTSLTFWAFDIAATETGISPHPDTLILYR